MALPEAERVLTLVIAATGLRISEALGLQWQDVDYANQRINLRRVWVDNDVLQVISLVGRRQKFGKLLVCITAGP